MSKLLIEQLAEELDKTASETNEASNEETSVEKTAEELGMEKIAHEISVLDQSRTLVAIGEELYKFACEIENEGIAALAADTYQVGERMGSCLTKTASEDGSALAEALEIAEDMHKIASIYADLADEVQTDEVLNKMAEAIIAISNELTDDANEVYAHLEKEASEETEEEEVVEEEATEEVEKEAEEKKKDGYRAKGIWAGTGIGAGAGAAIGAAIGKKLGVGTGAGALIGAAQGAALGNVGARIKQGVGHNKNLGHKHAILRTLTPTSMGEMNRATSTKDQLKTLNVGGAVAGGWGRFVHKKKKIKNLYQALPSVMMGVFS